MTNWIEKLNGFLALNNREILNSVGSVSYEIGKEDFEKVMQRIKNRKNDKIVTLAKCYIEAVTTFKFNRYHFVKVIISTFQ